MKSILDNIPDGGPSDKIVKSKIVELKMALRGLVKWNKLFYVYKATSFPFEVESFE